MKIITPANGKSAYKQLAIRHREMQTFFKLSKIILSSNSLEKSYDRIVDEVCAATGFPIAGIGLYDQGRKRIILRGQRSRLGRASRPTVELPLYGTPAGRVVQTGKPLISTHLLERSKYPRLRLRRLRAQTFVGYPMKIDKKTIGCLNLLHTENIKVSKELGQWIGSLANFVAVLTSRKRAEEEIRLSRERLRELSERTQSAIENERRRIAREIHDELGQQLSLIQLEMGMIRNRLPRSEKGIRLKMNSMIKLIDSSIRSVQRISADLRPALLDDLGIGAALEWAVKSFQKRTKILCKISIHPPNLILDQERSTVLFRVLQESLTNIVRHAKATKVHVYLTKRNRAVELIVRDNGIGISAKKVSDSHSIGLIGMRERVRPSGGSVMITGIPGKKTEVVVTVPITQ